MPKKKIKKPVSKRVRKNTPKAARKPRAKKPAVITTTEPVMNTLMREDRVQEFLTDVGAVPPVEYTKISFPTRLDDMDTKEDTISKIKQISNNISKWWTGLAESSFEKLKDFAFDYPLVFAISFCTVLCAVAVGVAAAMRYFRW